MISRIAYRKCVKVLEHYRDQDAEDRASNPNAIPIDWRSSLEASFERTIRENVHGYISKHQIQHGIEELFAGFVRKNMLVPYHGGYAFPGQYLPNEEEIREQATKTVEKLFGEKR